MDKRKPINTEMREAHRKYVRKLVRWVFDREATEQELRGLGRAPFYAGWEAAQKVIKLK